MHRTSSATLELPEDTLVMLSFHFLFMRKPTHACPLLASEWYSRWPLWRVVKLSSFLRTSPSPITSHFMLFLLVHLPVLARRSVEFTITIINGNKSIVKNVNTFINYIYYSKSGRFYHLKIKNKKNKKLIHTSPLTSIEPLG